MIEPEELKMWGQFLSSDIRLELLRLFHTNCKLVSNIDEIAKQIGRTKDEIQPELNAFLTMGLVKKSDSSGSFCLDESKDREIQTHIMHYLLNGGNWTIRSCCESFC